jgi:CheY-like chemotaxis protein
MTRYSKSVLLVDDDPADLALFGRELRKLGYRVLETDKADIAMAEIVSGSVACVVTDQAVPISGHELVEVAKGVRKDIGVIFLSGAAQPSKPLPEHSTFISKDDRAGLQRAVQACMEQWAVVA